jgi:hypothetical protein
MTDGVASVYSEPVPWTRKKWAEKDFVSSVDSGPRLWPSIVSSHRDK